MTDQSTPLVVVDFSCFVNTCWWPAKVAEEANAKHRLACPDELCRAEENPCEKCPPQYDARKVVLNNVEGKLRTMLQDLRDRQIIDPEVVFVEDRKSVRKYAAFPAYKGNRKDQEKMPEDIFSLVKDHLKGLGYNKFCWSPDNEADDAIASLVCDQPSLRDTVIASSDKDLWQLLEAEDIGVYVYRLTLGKFVTRADIAKEFGVDDPRHIPLCKALWGDAGDNIPNAVPRMQGQLLPLIKKSSGSLYTFQEQVGANSDALTKRCKELLVKGFKQVQINYDLVKLDEDCGLEWDNV